MLDLHEVKESLTIEDIEQYMAHLEAEPVRRGETLICKTVCHCGNSMKLYYYENTKLFKCFTECPEDSFDVFELTQKIRKRTDKEYSLIQSVRDVATYFGINTEELAQEKEELRRLPDWQIFKRYRKHAAAPSAQAPQGLLKEYSSEALDHLPRPRIIPWLKEGISQESLDLHKICYDPKNHGIVIPHYDINNRLIGIRERTLIKENEEFGKYLPATINGTMYNHPLGLALYNLNNSKKQIQKIKKVICFESEKSCLKYDSMYGIDNNITVACCGSNISRYQFMILKNLGVQEIIVAFDKQFKKIGDEEHLRWSKKLYNFHAKYGGYILMSYMFDKEGVIGYKESPIDRSKEEFDYLYKHRVFI